MRSWCICNTARNAQALAETLESDDDLIASMREAAPLEGDSKVLGDAMARAYDLQGQAETMQPGETNIPGDFDSSADDHRGDISLNFLRPAQQSGELGRLGGYRILEVLGVGGMGVVFRAEDPRLKRQVALKVMMPHVAGRSTAKERFLREAQAAAAVDHDNVVQIFQVGEDAGVPFMAMQYLQGESLRDRQKRDGRLPQADVVRIGREVAQGLAAAHSKGLVHRDIKPDNIWLEKGRDRVRILDFGLARSYKEEAGLTQTGEVLGTPRYMAPEQANGETPDQRSDLFSLGSVLYHLATGKAPFDGDNLVSVLMAVSQAAYPAIATIAADVHPALIRLIGRLMAQERKDRPESADEVAQALADLEAELSNSRSDDTLVDRPQASPVTRDAAAQPVLDRRQVAGKGGGHQRIVAIVAVGLLGLLAIFAASVVFKINTAAGTLVLKVVGEDFETAVRGQRVRIRNTKTNVEYTIDLAEPESQEELKPGEYRFVLTDSAGLKTKTDRFTIQSDKTQVVEVYWEPAAHAADNRDAAVAENGRAGSAESTRTDTPAPTPPDPADPADPADMSERAIAEYLLRKGAVVLAEGREEIRSPDGLPAGDDWHLRVIYMPPSADDQDLRLLSQLPELKDLSVTGSRISGSGFQYLKNSTLESLAFGDPAVPIDESAYGHISQITSIKKLSLRHREPDRHTFKTLMALTNLEHISLYEMPTKAADLSDLPSLPNLTDLNLFGARVGDEITPTLAACGKLRAVWLKGLTDAGLAPLHEAKQLRFLNVSDSEITAAGLQQLRSALPKCDISWKGKQYKPLAE